MTYQPKPMPFDPKSITGISEKVLVSHYENNYVGAVKRLNAIGTQLAELDFAKAPNFVINGLKREELVASIRGRTPRAGARHGGRKRDGRNCKF